jgi:hypothetical protein
MQHKKKIALLCIYILMAGVLLAQDDISKYTDFLPPPPNAAAITKNGTLSVNKNTGAPNVSIPLFTMKGNKLTVPISLSYSTTGIKVDEIASRAGMGWVASIGGVVTRTVRDKPDSGSFSPRLGSPWGSVGDNASTFNFIKAIGTGSDAEPDLFSFNFNGYSGTFVFDDAMRIVQVNKSDLKIYSNFFSSDWNFKIITPDGVCYFFGGTDAVEKTQRTSTCAKSFAKTATAWYLKKIIHPNKETVLFNYEAHDYNYETGISQTIYWVGATGFSGPPCPGSDGDNTCPTPIPSLCVNIVKTEGVLLRSITVPGKSEAEIFYQSRSDCEDSLISRIVYKDLVTNTEKQSFRLVYSEVEAGMYPNPEKSINGQDFTPYLVQLKDYSADTLLSRSHYFFYEDPEHRPSRLSFAQDHWGYYNGKGNASLVPKPDGKIDFGGAIAISRFPGATADREADSIYVMKGALSKIIYPTGGYDTLVYESNSIRKLVNHGAYTELSDSKVGVGPHTAASKTFTFIADMDQEVTMFMNCVDRYGLGGYGPSNNGTIAVANTNTNLSTNLAVGETGLVSFNITANDTTYVTITSSGDVVSTSVSITYRPSNPHYWENTAVGGLRLGSVTSVAEGSVPIKRRYYYGNIDSLYASSLLPPAKPNYIVYHESRIYCEGDRYKTCNAGYLYSSSLNSLFDFQSGPASYRTVVEAMGDNLDNGCTQTTYFAVADGAGDVLLGDDFGATKTNYSNLYNGKPTEEISYKNSSGSLVPVKKTISHYIFDISSQQYVNGYVLNNHSFLYDPIWNSGMDTTIVTFYALNAMVDMIRYRTLCDWVYLDSSTTTVYDANGSNGITTSERFFYDSASHTQLTRTETNDSKNSLITTVFTYPFNYRGTAVYDSMISRNMTASPITKKVYNSSDLITTQSFNYGFYNTAQVELSSITSAKGSAAATTDLDLGAYDPSGNVLQYTGKDGLPHAFIWDYDTHLPVAHTVNAMFGATASTSFESNGNGNWSFSSSGVRSDSGSVTGNQAYTLATAYVEKNLLDASQTYVVTYWLKNNGGTAAINSGSGGSVLIDKNGWKLYQREITGVGSVRISGTGVIDELRFYPKNAQMITYTYDPLVGLTTQCDANNRILFYEYDNFNHLLRIRDADKNILKTFEYKYKEAQ